MTSLSRYLRCARQVCCALVLAGACVPPGAAQCELGELVGSVVVADDLFAAAVDISGDLAVFGVPLDDNLLMSDVGSAYVFRREATDWIQEARLGLLDWAANDSFGWAVGISGGRIVVGVPWDDDRAAESGSAQVFRRDGASWIWEAEAAPDLGHATRAEWRQSVAGPA